MLVIDFEILRPSASCTSALSSPVDSADAGVTLNVARMSPFFASNCTGAVAGSEVQPVGRMRRAVAGVVPSKLCSRTATDFGFVSGKR